ncbi:FAD dependent oxidoreductase [Podospora didyma]|uniref:FAD dependent oxidoreductase n=1 Tax=Podospora didyma TaxID=330526 RepID=A0AAE0P5Q9_9PEZI|nr:FAD dependent oxidoreductase [Podospora didyma]
MSVLKDYLACLDRYLMIAPRTCHMPKAHPASPTGTALLPLSLTFQTQCLSETMPAKQDPILIIGAGTFGLSTAYHLAQAGYTSITLLEKGDSIPSPLSAGNDINKIVRAEYEDPFYAELALAAISEWTTNPLFTPYFRQVGYLLGNSSAAPEKSRLSLARSLASIESHPSFAGGQITPITSRDDIRRVAPALDGPMAGWTGYFNRLAGYARAADALRALHTAVSSTVEINLGDAVTALKYDDDGGGTTRCIGAVTASGKAYTASTVILTLGASLPRLLPSIGPQITAKSWSIVHIQLTPSEAEHLAGIPVTYSRDLGFFFEPDQTTGLLKLSPSGAGYTNYTNHGGGGGYDDDKFSVPPDVRPGVIPAVDEEAIRKILKEHLPSLADRPFVDKKICWCADTADSEYVIDFVPGADGLIVASGDSGHAFKMLPLIGGWVMKVVESGEQAIEQWRWKKEQIKHDDVSWRVGKVRDLSEVM